MPLATQNGSPTDPSPYLTHAYQHPTRKCHQHPDQTLPSVGRARVLDNGGYSTLPVDPRLLAHKDQAHAP